MSSYSKNSVWALIIISAIIFAITMGVRQSLGLFIAPINYSLGLDIVSISFALAVGQFMWGLAQPIFGAIADKKGSLGVLIIGAILMFIGVISLLSNFWPFHFIWASFWPLLLILAGLMIIFKKK